QVSMVSNLNRSTHEDSDDDEPTKSSRINELSSKLLERFELSPDEQFVANYQCMLLRDVLLLGHMYLTTNFLLFFAYLPKQKGEVVHSGGLALRTGFTPGNRISKQWCVLKETTFNVYNSATDLYFPNVVLDLRYVLRVELSHETEKERSSALDPFTQESRTYRMRASSGHAARQWINLLKKQVFTAKQNGDHVSVKIPLRSIIDVEGNNMFDGVGEDRTLLLDLPNVPMMIRARVTDEYAVDDWYFMSLSCGEEIYKTLKELVGIKTGEATPDDRTALSKTEPKADRSNLEITGSLLRKLTRRSSGKEEPRVRYTTGGTGNGSPLVVSPRSQTPEHSDLEVEYSDEDTLPEPVTRFHRRHRGWGPGSFIKQVVSSANLIGHATSMWAAGPAHYSNPNSVELGADDPYYVTSEHDRQVANDHFKHHFSLPDNARLVSSYYAHFQKTIPTYGKMYVGEKEICFRSLLPGVNFLMILPFADVETCYKEKGFRFGYSGLVIVIHGHEELFMEFATSSSRDDCELVLLKQMDALSHRRHRPKDTAGIERGKLERARLQMYEDKLTSSAGLDVPIIIEENPYFKTEVRPLRPYKFTLLTIGSRGDVQPYIALGKGLTAEGHRVTIATHKEFQEWIESHGLEFAEVAGNPAELMSLMVTHGTMSVSFLKEASTKFRGWISELLSTSWEACQGADVLIESPSAMAGLHIAEALNIPYLRAFTMPWTKTRAYPHAFIVPDQKRGGSYNYLTHVMFETVFWKGISGQVNPWRVDTLGLPRTNLEKMQQFKVPFSYNVSPTVFPPSVDFPDWVKVTGYWFLDESLTYTPPDALVQFIAAAGKAGKKLVYIGFGSIVVSDPKELTQAVVDAVVQADVYCILNKGWSDRLNKKDEIEVELPPLVYNAGAIPHDWLFPKVDAAVHHGGSGTTGASLRAGTPTIIKPFFGDQYFYGGRVQDLGAGVYLRKLNAKSLAKAIKDVTTKTRIIEKAKLVGEQIRAENGVSTAIETIYSELEYARKLITEKRKAYKNEQSEGQVDENSVAEDEGSWMMV
ncbi:glycosyltransferase family 1 protein, partial [Babjeviella inositovora NRRL Y-12698]